MILLTDKKEQRKIIIKLYKKNKTQTEISNLLDIPQTTISYCIRKYKKTGLLTDLPRSGAPKKLSPEQYESVKNHLLNYAPERYGGESLGWTTKMAIKFIDDKYGVKYGMRHIQKLFRKIGLSLITPRSEAYKGSKLARNSYREEFKKNSKINIWIAPALISMKQHLD